MVRGAVGIVLHAVQDFYAHSTWVDDAARRELTWQEWHAGPVGRPGHVEGAAADPGRADPDPVLADVVTGRWRLDGDPRHGSFGLRGPGSRPVPTAIPVRGRLAVPRVIGGVDAGITLDTTWQAEVGARVRGTDLSGREAFDAAAGLALRSSGQVVAWLEREAASAGASDLWHLAAGTPQLRRTTQSPRGLRHRVSDDPILMPHLFLSAGAGAGVEPAEDGWFVRVTRSIGVPRADRVAGPIPGWFARGDVVGPLPRAPRRQVPDGWSAVAFRRGPEPEIRVLGRGSSTDS